VFASQIYLGERPIETRKFYLIVNSMINSLPINLRDRRIDTLDRDRENFITVALRKQVEFAFRNVPFWRNRFEKAGIYPDRINKLKYFTLLPPLSKKELRLLSVWELIPKCSIPRIYRCRGTSGTTGAPTSIFWTQSDWRALVETMTRLLENHKPDIDILAFNGYHQGHAAAPAYDDAIRLLGGISIPRHYLLTDDEFSTLNQLSIFGCNTLIFPERNSSNKRGQTVVELLQQQRQFFSEYGIQWWLGSRNLFTEEVRKIATEQGVVSVTNLYGTSEFGTLGVSCRSRPEEYHLALGNVFVEVVDKEGLPVMSGERGRIVCTFIFTSYVDGGLGPHEGSQIFRLDIGDEATFLDGTCECGLSSPRIRDICRY
jgi:phenylacetate-CoA ligase